MPPTGLSTSMGRHHGRQVRTVGDSQRVRHRPDRILTGRRPQSPDKGGKAAISSRHCLRNSLPPQKAGHRTGFRSAPSVPLPRIFSSQALGKITDDPKPKGHQPVHPASALPDGNTGCDPAHVETGRLGRVHRFIGRVPPRSHRPPVSEASRLFVRGQGVPIQSPPLRPKARPPAVHPADFSGCGLTPGTRHKGVLLFRRLADRRRHPTPPHSTPGFTLGLVQSLGFLINWEKSALTPTQHPVFLGAEIDMPNQLARPTRERVGKILVAARALRARETAPARTWMQFLGYLASLVEVLPDCRLYMRPLQIHFLHFSGPTWTCFHAWSRLPISFAPSWSGGCGALFSRRAGSSPYLNP